MDKCLYEILHWIDHFSTALYMSVENFDGVL